jgi:hypothetical protein
MAVKEIFFALFCASSKRFFAFFRPNRDEKQQETIILHRFLCLFVDNEKDQRDNTDSLLGCPKTRFP